MNRYWLTLTMVSALALSARGAEEVKVSDLSLEGEIQGENISFTLAFKAEMSQKNAVFPLVVGDVAYLDGKLPGDAELQKQADRYLLKFGSGGGFFGPARQAVTCRFASRPIKNGDWRSTSFAIPLANVRKISVICDRNDLEVKFPGGLDVKRSKTKDGRTQVTAYLGPSGTFDVAWKPEIKKLDAELVVTCEANTITTASVGALRTDTVFTHRVIQGALSRLVYAIPDVNIIQVQGDGIQDWRIDKSDPKQARLVVMLSRPREDVYRLRVESEMPLAKFPCSFNLPVISPEGMLRTSGFLTIGTASAVRLQVARAGGLTQIDQASFPAVPLQLGTNVIARAAPSRSVYAYQYASTPYTLGLGADDVVSSFTADGQYVLTFADNELALDASIEIDVKDAPAREILIETEQDPGWTVTSITGKNVSEPDADVREEAVDAGGVKQAKRIIYVPFKQAVLGPALINIRMEKSLKPESMGFATPGIKVRDAKSERGYIVIAAEKGVRLKVTDSRGVRDVHTGLLQMRVEGAQQAFRFKEAGWGISLGIERAASSIHSEVFHLVSVGEGVMYCSAAVTYHIGGSPAQDFRIHVPQTIENVEFTGADIEGWTREGEVCTVRLQRKIIGDCTLLVTFDRQHPEQGTNILVGEIETIGSESEVGYVAIASSASIKISTPEKLPSSIIKIDRGEIPAAYLGPITDPLLASFKYVRNPHALSVRVDSYKTEQLLGQVADYVKIGTRISKDGESVSTATYYVKNASRQYLVVSMPSSMNLWSVKYVNDDGTRADAPSQKKPDGTVLIPVGRPRDPNSPICVEVTYAETHGALGFWRSGVKGMLLAAPKLTEAHAAFADWRIEVPAEFSIAGSIGNMSTSLAGPANGLGDVGKKTWLVLRALLDGLGGYTIRRALAEGYGGGTAAEFTRPVNLSGSDPLSMRLIVVPAWVGCAGSARSMAGALILGAAALLACARKRAATWAVAFGLTAAAVGVAASATGRSALAGLLAALIVALAVRIMVRSGFGRIWGGVRLVFGQIDRALGAIGRARAGRRARIANSARAAKEEDDLPFEPDAEPASPDGSAEQGGKGKDDANRQGSAGIRATGLLAAMAVIAVTSVAERDRIEVFTPAPLVMNVVKVAIEGPGTGKDIEQSAAVTLQVEFTADSLSASSVVVAPANCVLREYDLGSKDLELVASPAGYRLNVKRSGKYKAMFKYQTPVQKQETQWLLSLPLPENIRNTATIRLPEAGLDVQCESAVMFTTREQESSTEAEAVFGSVRTADFVWKPRVRKTKLEEVLFFCEANSLASLQPGVIELATDVRCQIAQGEIKELKILVPQGMSVTAVQADSLATWSFDPDNRLLDAILERPVSGEFSMKISSQMAKEGLPYSAVIGALQVLGGARQRGSVALAAPDTVQVRVAEAKGVNPINIEDFSAQSAAVREGQKGKGAFDIRKAFRYSQPGEVAVRVETERVLPEVRVVEAAALSIADERIQMGTTLALSIAKAGIFSVELEIPPDFDVETLTGKDVSHWDEIKEGNRVVVVHFARQITANTDINLVITRTEKGIEQKITVPRITVRDAAKHTGRLTVSGERGVRMMIESHSGVDVRKASEEGIRQAGVLVFDILRPTWSVALKTDVMVPVLKPEMLQLFDLAEGMLQCRAFINYRIENAGIKVFRLKSPFKGISLSITGQNIARVSEVDKEKGIWQVELQNKVEDAFGMTASYQVPYDPGEKEVRILPVQLLNTEEQSGYVAVTCMGRVQVELINLTGLKVEDQRNIPASFRAGDLSSAIRSYKSIRPDWELALSVVRHDAARVLPASIRHVRLVSTMSTSDRTLTHCLLRMIAGNMRYLRVKLPNADDILWTVLVDGKDVRTSRDGELYCIPLEEQQQAEQVVQVDMAYAGGPSPTRLSWRSKYEAPKFGGPPSNDAAEEAAWLPLNDIEWDFYALPGMEYSWFGGTMDVERRGWEVIAMFDEEKYKRENLKQKEESLEVAKKNLDEGQVLMQAGNPKVAQRAFQQALNYSQGQPALNEDARIQLRNLQKQQLKLGLINRRDAVRFSRNIFEPGQMEQMQGFHGGQYTQDYARKVERRLSDRDNDALETVADKMIEQQAAAAGVVRAINVTMPEHGKLLSFKRMIQVDPQGELSIKFRSGSGEIARVAGRALPALLLFIVMWAVITRATGPASSAAGLAGERCGTTAQTKQR